MEIKGYAKHFDNRNPQDTIIDIDLPSFLEQLPKVDVSKVKARDIVIVKGEVLQSSKEGTIVDFKSTSFGVHNSNILFHIPALHEQETTTLEIIIRELLEKKGVIAAVVEYRRLVNCDLYTAKKYVDELRREQETELPEEIKLYNFRIYAYEAWGLATGLLRSKIENSEQLIIRIAENQNQLIRYLRAKEEGSNEERN